MYSEYKKITTALNSQINMVSFTGGMYTKHEQIAYKRRIWIYTVCHFGLDLQLSPFGDHCRDVSKYRDGKDVYNQLKRTVIDVFRLRA